MRKKQNVIALRSPGAAGQVRVYSIWSLLLYVKRCQMPSQTAHVLVRCHLI